MKCFALEGCRPKLLGSSSILDVIVYDIAQEYTASKNPEEGFANPARQIYSNEKTTRMPAVAQASQELIWKTQEHCLENW